MEIVENYILQLLEGFVSEKELKEGGKVCTSFKVKKES